MSFTKCPKCGFQQPTDIYCAQCGVNMSKVTQSPLQKLKRPESIAIASLLTVFVSLYAFMKLSGKTLSLSRSESSLLNRKSRSQLDQSDRPERSDLSARSDRAIQVQGQMDLNDEGENSGRFRQSRDLAPASEDSNRPATQTTLASASSSAETAASESSATARAARSPQTLKAVWGEFQRPALATLGIEASGLYPVDNVATQLRPLAGSYRIMGTSEHSLVDKSAGPIVVSLTDRAEVRIGFETTETEEQVAELTVEASVLNPGGPPRLLQGESGKLDQNSGLLLVFPQTATNPNSPAGSQQPVSVLILMKKNAGVAESP